MKKTLLAALAVLLLATGCVDSLNDYNVDPKNPAVVPATSLFSTAQRALAREVNSTNVNQNPFRLYVQYWAQTTYYDESNYDINTRQINRNYWDALYTDVLGNLNEAKRLVPNDQFISAAVKTNRTACIEIMSVYAWATLVNTYGNVPYTEALDFTRSQPKYDDAKTIYSNLFVRLDAALASIVPTAGGMGANDIVYNGRMDQWVKFGHALKLRMALTIADDDAVKAKALAEQAAPGVFASITDQAQVTYASAFPNTNPLFEDLVQSGRLDFVGASPFVDTLNFFNDPRRASYFKPVSGTSDFEGGTYGSGNNYSSYSAPGSRLENPTLPGVLLSYSEVEFLLAEAVARGFAVGGTVADHYDAAITASIIDAGSSANEAATYLAQPTVAYATAVGTGYKEKIGLQKWIALYDQPTMAWTEWRRLDTPKLEAAPDGETGIPLRFPYPTTEKNLNGANNAAASAAIGGDKVDTKIFWDKF